MSIYKKYSYIISNNKIIFYKLAYNTNIAFNFNAIKGSINNKTFFFWNHIGIPNFNVDFFLLFVEGQK